MAFSDQYTSRLGTGRRGSTTAARRIQGQRGALYAFGNSAAIDAYLRDERGRIAKGGTDATLAINYRLARELQELAAESLRRQIKRPSVSSGRLAKVILNRRNQFHDRFGFGVGIPAYLDASEAKYWRAIEQGSTYFVGRVIKGVWGAPLGGGIGTGKYGNYFIPQQPYSAFGRGTGQKLYPLSRPAARAVLRAQGDTGRVSGVIQKPIEAYGYFSEAWERFNIRSRTDSIINQMFPQAERRPPRKRR